MEYTMKLTRRHEFPDAAKESIFPSDELAKRQPDESKEHYKARLLAWADCMVPDDCTKLLVYMSGYPKLHMALLALCRQRGLDCICLFPNNASKKKMKHGDESWSKCPEAYRGISVEGLMKMK